MKASVQPDAPRRNIHSHAWIMGVVGAAVGLALMVYAPSLPAVSQSVLLFAGFHLVGGIVLAASAYSLGLRKLLRRWGWRNNAPAANQFDFGWGPEWMNGLAVAALAAFAGAIGVMVAAPAFWPLALGGALLAALFIVGALVMRSFQSRDFVVLPMVRLLRSSQDRVLDAGCGSGRTSIALARCLGAGRIVAVDRFDADYIDEGGRGHIDHNLRVAGLTEQVTVMRADLTQLPFPDNEFDAAVSTHVFDHLGAGKAAALGEIHRVLQPGGRFLMAVWTPSWPMAAVANIFALLLTDKRAWRRLAADAGLRVVDEGVFNFAWFVLLEKPSPQEMVIS